MPSMYDFRPPNYALYQADGLPYWKNTFSHSSCDSCEIHTPTDLLTVKHWDGIFRVLISPGEAGPRTDDVMTCDWKPGTGTGVTYVPVVVAANAVFKTTTNLVRVGSNQWAINVYCNDDGTGAGSPDEDLLVWRGLQRKTIDRPEGSELPAPTIGLTGPAGWYDYDDGCDITVTELQLVRAGRDGCPCPDNPTVDCSNDDPQQLSGTTLNIKNFNISDWKVPWVSSCWGSSPSECSCGYCHSSTSTWPFWDGTIPARNISSVCQWGFYSQGGWAGSRRVQSAGSGVTVSDCSVCNTGAGTTQGIGVGVHFMLSTYWVLRVTCIGQVGGPACGDQWLGVWFKSLGNTPEGAYERADQDSWNLLCPAAPFEDCCSCQDKYCAIGPDFLEIEVL